MRVMEWERNGWVSKRGGEKGGCEWRWVEDECGTGYWMI